jgi:hypothetical protein
MKFNSLRFSLLCLFICCTTHAAFADWKLFKTNEFHALYPHTPDYDSEIVKSDVGDLKLKMYMYDASKDSLDDNYVYGVISTEYPDSLINSAFKDKLANLFRNSIDGAVTNVKGKLLSEKEITLDGYPGREIRINYPEGSALIKMRLYLVRNKMFILQTISDMKKEENPSVVKFLDSFGLVK